MDGAGSVSLVQQEAEQGSSAFPVFKKVLEMGLIYSKQREVGNSQLLNLHRLKPFYSVA